MWYQSAISRLTAAAYFNFGIQQGFKNETSIEQVHGMICLPSRDISTSKISIGRYSYVSAVLLEGYRRLRQRDAETADVEKREIE